MLVPCGVVCGNCGLLQGFSKANQMPACSRMLSCCVTCPHNSWEEKCSWVYEAVKAKASKLFKAFLMIHFACSNTMILLLWSIIVFSEYTCHLHVLWCNCLLLTFCLVTLIIQVISRIVCSGWLWSFAQILDI